MYTGMKNILKIPENNKIVPTLIYIGYISD